MAQEVRYKVIWTDPAICDLEKINRDLRRRNPVVAFTIGESLLKKAKMLEQFPEIGRVWKPGDPWRLLLYRPYKIFYRVLHEQRAVEIAHVRHGAQSEPTTDDLPIE